MEWQESELYKLQKPYERQAHFLKGKSITNGINPTRHKSYKSTTEFLCFFCLSQQTCILLFAPLISDACLSLYIISQINWRGKKKSQHIQLFHHGSVISLWFYFCMFCDIHCQQQIHKPLIQKNLTQHFLYFLSDFVPVYQMCQTACCKICI